MTTEWLFNNRFAGGSVNLKALLEPPTWQDSRSGSTSERQVRPLPDFKRHSVGRRLAGLILGHLDKTRPTATDRPRLDPGRSQAGERCLPAANEAHHVHRGRRLISWRSCCSWRLLSTRLPAPSAACSECRC